MPPAQVTIVLQNQTYPPRRSERKTTNRAASVPVGRRENSGLEIFQSKKQKPSSLGIENVPSSSLPSLVIARGRKRESSPCAVYQAGCAASTLVAEQITDANEQHPRKRRKRSLSTPAVPRSTQLSTQLRSLRRSRSGVSSPTTDAEYVPPSRVSTRLSRKIQTFMNSHNSDIYTHLADPEGGGNLLNNPLSGSAILSTPYEVVGSQSVKRSRGRRRKVTDLTSEDAKTELMEEWAQMRRSQGTLPLPGMDVNACFSQTPLYENRKGAASSLPPEAMTQRSSPDVDLVKSRTMAVMGIPQSQETVDGCDSPLTQMRPENALPVGMSASGKKLDHNGIVPPSDGETEQSSITGLGIETLSTSILDANTKGNSLADQLADILETTHDIELSKSPALSSPSLLAKTMREDSVRLEHSKLTKSLINERPRTVSLDIPPKGGHSATFSQAYPFDADNIHLDEEFYMLDIPEVFTLPWVPVSSNLYVPPSLGKLISGMREQLTMEARARQRAEELYQTELSRRISAEEIIEDLRTELEGRRRGPSRKPTH